MNKYCLSFSSNGIKQIHVYSPDVIGNELQAQSIAYGGIKLWYEQQNLPVPESVQDVRYVDQYDYQWDVLPLK